MVIVAPWYSVIYILSATLASQYPPVVGASTYATMGLPLLRNAERALRNSSTAETSDILPSVLRKMALTPASSAATWMALVAWRAPTVGRVAPPAKLKPGLKPVPGLDCSPSTNADMSTASMPLRGITVLPLPAAVPIAVKAPPMMKKQMNPKRSRPQITARSILRKSFIDGFILSYKNK